MDTHPGIWSYGAQVSADLYKDAQHSLYAAELTLAEARGNEYRSLVQLYKALGGGWQQQDTRTQAVQATPAPVSDPNGHQ